jgi:hypothetical protein
MPEIFNTNQGCQFTSELFTSYLLDNKIKISTDFEFYNKKRQLQSFDYICPLNVYIDILKALI